MLFVRPLADKELEQLQRMKRREIGRVSQRAHIVLLSAQSCCVSSIAGLFGLSPATVRSWIRKFEEMGPQGLYDSKRTGRPRKSARSA